MRNFSIIWIQICYCKGVTGAESDFTTRVSFSVCSVLYELLAACYVFLNSTCKALTFSLKVGPIIMFHKSALAVFRSSGVGTAYLDWYGFSIRLKYSKRSSVNEGWMSSYYACAKGCVSMLNIQAVVKWFQTNFVIIDWTKCSRMK